MTPLPLTDRVALLLSRRPRTILHLAANLERDRGAIESALDEMEERGIVRSGPGSDPPLWHLEDGIEVRYRPGRIEVEDAADEPARPEPTGRCSATTQAGERCKLKAIEDARCQHHAP